MDRQFASDRLILNKSRFCSVCARRVRLFLRPSNGGVMADVSQPGGDSLAWCMLCDGGTPPNLKPE